MRWLNKYHKGFNRLWLVLSCLMAFAFVGVKWLAGAYKPRTAPPIIYEVVPPGTPPPRVTPMTEAEKQKKKKKAEAELKTYQTRQKWIVRRRFVRDLLGGFIVTFAIGHGVFLVVWWIIRGFR